MSDNANLPVEDLKPHDRVLTEDGQELEIAAVIKDDSILDRVLVVWWQIVNNARVFVGVSTFARGEKLDAGIA